MWGRMDDVSLCAALGRNTTAFSDGIQVAFPLMPPPPPAGGKKLSEPENPSDLTSPELLAEQFEQQQSEGKIFNRGRNQLKKQQTKRKQQKKFASQSWKSENIKKITFF